MKHVNTEYVSLSVQVVVVLVVKLLPEKFVQNEQIVNNVLQYKLYMTNRHKFKH